MRTYVTVTYDMRGATQDAKSTSPITAIAAARTISMLFSPFGTEISHLTVCCGRSLSNIVMGSLLEKPMVLIFGGTALNRLSLRGIVAGLSSVASS